MGPWAQLGSCLYREPIRWAHGYNDPHLSINDQNDPHLSILEISFRIDDFNSSTHSIMFVCTYDYIVTIIIIMTIMIILTLEL